jgi:hypothetical protein
MEPALAGLTPVGWFHSHTRSEICLRDDDLALHNQFFPETWQIALVIQPGMDGSTRAGFFFREPADRSTESSYKTNVEAFRESRGVEKELDIGRPGKCDSATANSNLVASQPAPSPAPSAEGGPFGRFSGCAPCWRDRALMGRLATPWRRNHPR